MSHYTRIKTELRDTRIVRITLKDMKRENLISDFQEKREKDQPTFLVQGNQGGEYRLKFNLSSEVYELGASDSSPDWLRDGLESRYAKIMVLEKLRAQGFTAQILSSEGNQIKIRARKVA